MCLWATVFAASRNSLDVPSVADPMKYTKKELRRGGTWECTMRFRKDKSNTPARSTPRERGARACLKGPSKVVAAWGCQSDGKGSLCPEDSGSTAQTLCSPTLALTVRQTRRGMAVTSTFRRTETLKPLCSQTCGHSCSLSQSEAGDCFRNDRQTSMPEATYAILCTRRNTTNRYSDRKIRSVHLAPCNPRRILGGNRGPRQNYVVRYFGFTASSLE